MFLNDYYWTIQYANIESIRAVTSDMDINLFSSLSLFCSFFFFFTQNVRRSPNSDSLNCEARRFGTEVSPTHHQQQQQSRYNQAIKPAKTRLQRQREEVQ